MTREQADSSATLAADQGLYNGFLAAGLARSLIAEDPSGFQFKVFFLLCVIAAFVFSVEGVMGMAHPAMEQVATGVHLVRGAHVNWVLVEDGDAVTLIDTGYPGDAEKLLASLSHIGRSPVDVSAVLLTHGHPDHIGSAERFRTHHGAAVHVHRDEEANARGERIEQISEAAILRVVWRPRVARWLADVIRLGGPRPDRVGAVTTFAGAAPLDVPGNPVPLHTPGHTSGHTCFHLPDRGVLVAGDAVMTAHAVVAKDGPQLLPAMFNTDHEQARASLSLIEPVAADVVLVGHGPAFRGSPAELVRQARG